MKHGIPEITKFGKRAQLAIIYPFIHSYNIAHLSSISDSLHNLCKKGEANWINYAMVMDRMSLLKNGHQLYGTQVLLPDLRLDRPLSIQVMNDNRRKIGLAPIGNK